MSRRLPSICVSYFLILMQFPGCGPDPYQQTEDPAAQGDAGIFNDVGKNNDASPDGTPSPPNDLSSEDACVSPTSCDVIFRYPQDNYSKVELFGSFTNWQTGTPMTLKGSSWETTVHLDDGQRVEYKFVLDEKAWVSDPNNPNVTQDEFKNSVLDVACPDPCQSSNSDGGSQPTTGFDWRDGVMYFVLLDRFFDGDSSNNKPEPGVKAPANFQGGDLKGLLQKIQDGYFNDLGVNVIWISSPIDAPDGKYIGVDDEYYTGYHGYWPTKMEKVEERLGDLNLLQQVVSAAHQKKIRIVMDYVMNHVHKNSQVYADHKDWFWDLNYNGKSCVCGHGCSWEVEPDRLRCWFMDYLPDFNFTVSAARKFSIDNALKWIADSGVDGLRLDAVKHIDLSWLTDIRREVQNITPTGQRFYLVGETFTGDKGLLKQYIDPKTKLDGQFDFPLRAELVKTLLMRQGSMNNLKQFLDDNDGYYGGDSIMGTFLGNHDLPRAIHLAEDQPQFGNWDSGKSRAWYNLPSQPSSEKPYQRLTVAFTALMTLPGIPLIYYGDEIALAGGGDPDNRKFMPWTGYSPHQLTVKEHLKKLTQIRHEHSALRYGRRETITVSADVYAYKMTHGSDTLTIVLNRSDETKQLSLPNTSYTDLLTQKTSSGSQMKILPRSSMILK